MSEPVKARTPTQVDDVLPARWRMLAEGPSAPRLGCGPLVDLRGPRVGINTLIFSRTGGYQGIGFAIPVDTVKRITDQLIADGTVERVRL